MGLKSDRPASVACRCTVFTKSDMIHLQNRGEKLEEALRFGVACGTATVMEEGVKLCKPEGVKELFHSVIITEL